MVGNRSEMPIPGQLDIDEEYNKMKSGENYNKVAIMNTYLDSYEYDIQVIPETIFQKDSSETQALIEQKIQLLGTMFPEKFMANQDVLFEDVIKSYGETVDKYTGTLPPPSPVMPAEGTQAPTGQPTDAGMAPLSPEAVPPVPNGNTADLEALSQSVNQALKS